MRGAKHEDVAKYVEEEERRSGPLFVLESGSLGLVCRFGPADRVYSVGMEDDALHLGVVKYLRRLGRAYPDEAQARAALQRVRK